ncbi:flagellar hook assembly protein FlgD [Gemmatimonas sp.]|jgi:flagellar basal-body rod modification protein FlgD|uniref:flagellar hook assembly protein FlgD n=1 Tax=Gemmatimonas sp. TaxID=1962908 RepID=UPI0037BFEC34
MLTAVRNTFGSSVFNTTPATTPPTTAPVVPTKPPEPPKGPAEPSAPRTLPQNASAMGRDEFLKMLVAQLKNQDPLNPMDGKDMAAQLAQFSTVEQLIQMNKTLEGQQSRDGEIIEAIGKLEKTQMSRADELAQLIEGQMAMATVGKTGVTLGNNAFVDREGNGTLVVDTGTRTGIGRVTVTNSKGEVVGTIDTPVAKAGMQSFELGDLFMDPKLPPGKYSFTFSVATDGLQFQAVKTYTAGRITGMKYEKGNPILIIGDSMAVPMSKLTQIRA